MKKVDQRIKKKNKGSAHFFVEIFLFSKNSGNNFEDLLEK